MCPASMNVSARFGSKVTFWVKSKMLVMCDEVKKDIMLLFLVK